MKKSESSSAASQPFVPQIHEGIQFEFGEKSINQEYRQEVMNHIRQDLTDIKQGFSINGGIDSIRIEKAGNETHYGGKSPLFLTINFHGNKELKLVYKPRSLAPELILEQALQSIDGRVPRPMLDKKDHGYDWRIQGDHIQNKNSGKIATGDSFISEVAKLCCEKKANKNLILALKCMGFEDIHGENFLLDADRMLHFVDAEVFQTNMSVNVDDICSYQGTPNTPNDPSFPLDQDAEDFIREITQQAQKDLRQIPTRLVICSSQTYAIPTPFFMKDSLVIGKCHLKGLKRVDFKEYHTAFFAKFLFENGYIDVKESDNLETIKEKINEIFATPQPLGKINAELDAVAAIKQQNPGELPAFRFHLSEKWIECPLTGERLQLK